MSETKIIERLPVTTKGVSWKTSASEWLLLFPHRLFSIVITVVVETIAVALHLYVGNLSVFELILLGVATGSVTLQLEGAVRERHAQRRFQPVTPLAYALLSLFENLRDSPLEAHVKEGLDHRIRTLKNLLSGNQLEFTYSEQIEIANSLAKDTKTRLWAISTDKPSVLWREGNNTYFQTLKHLPSTCAKKRLILLKFYSLLDDYDESHGDFFEFTNWHRDNNFELHFRFIEPDSSVEDYISKNLVETPEGRLTDFLIRDKDCVYGRIRAATGNRVVLRFVTAMGPKDALTRYEELFDAAWTGSHDAEHVKHLLNVASQKKKMLAEHNASIDERRTALASSFSGKESGEKFFEEVCRRVKQAGKTVRAVDIAGCKDCLDQWGNRSEYHGFLNASITAARAGKKVRRLYVVRNFSDITHYPLVKVVLRQQLEAKIEVGILERATAITGYVNVDDYILVDGDFGFYLGEQQFSKGELEYGKNTLSKSHIKTFSAIFDELFDSELVKKLQLSDLQVESSV